MTEGTIEEKGRIPFLRVRDRRLISMPALFLIIGTVIYGSLWSYISIRKFLALNAYVFDLGINAERGWQILHVNLGLSGYFHTLINSGIVFPLAPLTGSGNYFAMLIFQAFSIAIVAPALYRIAIIKGLNWKMALLVSAVFFLYFPVYGIFWFDFHYQVFFFPLFVYGYMFYLQKRYLGAAILLILSGMVRFPYSIFPLGFAILEIVFLLHDRTLFHDRRRLSSLVCVFIVMSLLTLGGALISNIPASVNYSVSSAYLTTNQGFGLRIFAISLFLVPLFFISLISLRWIVFAFPAFFLILFSDRSGYTYHLILQGQYVAGIVPFLLLGFIDGIVIIGRRSSNLKFFHFRHKNFTLKHGFVTTAAVLLVSLLLLNSIFAPFGPLNKISSDNFNYGANTNFSLNKYAELNSMLELIPAGDPYVAFQNNLPQLLPRQLPVGNTLLMGGPWGNLGNFNLGNAVGNSWLAVNSENRSHSVPINYAMADANNSNFYQQPHSMYDLVNAMYSSGAYGILSEGNGLILLRYNYSGSIQYYIPNDKTFTAGEFINESGPNSGSLPITKVNDTSDNFMFYGPGTYLFPGKYEVSFFLKTNNVSSNNNIWLQVTANSGNTFLGFEHINGTWFHAADNWQEFNLTLNVDQIYGNVEFRGFGIEWSGMLSFNGVRIAQLSASQSIIHS